MRKSYRIQIILFIAIISFAFLSSADKDVFLFIGKNIPSPIKNLIYIFIPYNISPFAFIKTISLLIVISLSVYSLIQMIHNEKWLIKELSKSVFHTFFKNVNLEEKGTNYRVSFYKFYEYKWYSFTWHYNFLKKRLSKYKMKYGKNYLLQYYRIGYEDGNNLNEKTSKIACYVDESDKVYHLFAGKLFEIKENISICLNNSNINKIVEKIKDQINDKDIKNFYDSYFNSTIQENINHLLNLNNVTSKLTDDEKKSLQSFMTNTNTNNYYLLKIGNGKHSNHFIGFKVRKGTLFGVVVIDVLNENNNKDFYDILGLDEKNEQWLSYLLKTYSNIFSNALK